MKLNVKEIRNIMKQISIEKGNPLGLGTVELFLAPFDIKEIADLVQVKHIRFCLGLDINIVVNSVEMDIPES